MDNIRCRSWYTASSEVSISRTGPQEGVAELESALEISLGVIPPCSGCSNGQLPHGAPSGEGCCYRKCSFPVLVTGPGHRQHDDQCVMVTGYAPFFLSPRFLLIPSPRGISMVEGLNRETGRATEAVVKAYATELQTGA